MKVFCTVLSTASATSTTIQKLTPGFTAIFSSSPSLNLYFSAIRSKYCHLHYHIPLHHQHHHHFHIHNNNNNDRNRNKNHEHNYKSIIIYIIIIVFIIRNHVTKNLVYLPRSKKSMINVNEKEVKCMNKG